MTSTAGTRKLWFAVLDRVGASLPPEPGPGDRVALLVVRSRSYPVGPAFSGTTSVIRVAAGAPRLRHRVNAPEGHAVPLRGFAPPLAAAVGWTDARLSALTGTCVPATSRDFERVEDALLAGAREFGPPPKRPQHKRPRTPGRRALGAGRAAVTGSRR